MASKSAILAVRIISDEKSAVAGFARTGSAAEQMGGKLGRLTPGALALGAGLVAAGKMAFDAGKFLYSVGETFDEVTDTIRTGTGATGEQLDSLVQSAKTIGAQVPAEFEKIGPVLADVNTRLGLSGQTLETVSSQYLEAGRLLGTEISIQDTTAAFSAFKIEGDGVIGAMDTLFRVSQDTGVGMNELAVSVAKQAPALQMLGFNFDQASALVGGFDKAGIDADRTIAAMSKGLVSLARDGEEPAAAFQRVTGELDQLLKSGDQAGALNLAGTLFGTRGASQFIGAIQSGVLNMGQLQEAAKGSGDTILGVGAETMDAAEKWQILKNKALTALEPIGSAIFGGLGQGLDWVLSLTDRIDFSGFTKAEGPLTGIVSQVMSLVSAARDYLVPLIQLLAPIVQAAFSTIMSIIGPALGLITGLFQTLGSLLRGDWEGVWDGITGILGSALDLVTNLLQGAAGIFASIWNLITSIFSGAWSAITGAVTAAATSIIQTVVRFLTNVRDSIVSGVSGFVSFWTSGWDSFKTAVVTGAVKIVAEVKAIPRKILTALGNVGQLLASSGRDVITGFVGGIRNALGSIGDIARQIGSTLVGGVKAFLGISSPSRVFRRLGQWTGQGFRLGLEDEMPAISLTSSQLLPAPRVRSIYQPAQSPAAAAQTVINLNVTGALDPVAVSQQIVDLLSRHSRRFGPVQIGGLR